MAHTPSKNFLQSTGFRVVIDREKYPNMEFFVQSFQHPGCSVDAVEQTAPTVTTLPVPGNRVTFGELNLNIIVDEDMESYKEMHDWLDRTVNSNDIYCDITLIVLTSHNNSNIEIKYRNCMPITIGPIEFNSTVADTRYLTFDSTFRFTHFEII